MDHAATMRRTYELINAGDIAGFGELVADDSSSTRADQGSLPPRKGPSTSSAPCWRGISGHDAWSVEDLIAEGDKTVA